MRIGDYACFAVFGKRLCGVEHKYIFDVWIDVVVNRVELRFQRRNFAVQRL